MDFGPKFVNFVSELPYLGTQLVQRFAYGSRNTVISAEWRNAGSARERSWLQSEVPLDRRPALHLGSVGTLHPLVDGLGMHAESVGQARLTPATLRGQRRFQNLSHGVNIQRNPR